MVPDHTGLELAKVEEGLEKLMLPFQQANTLRELTPPLPTRQHAEGAHPRLQAARGN